MDNFRRLMLCQARVLQSFRASCLMSLNLTQLFLHKLRWAQAFEFLRLFNQGCDELAIGGYIAFSTAFPGCQVDPLVGQTTPRPGNTPPCRPRFFLCALLARSRTA